MPEAAEDAVNMSYQRKHLYAKEAFMTQFPVIDLEATGRRIKELRKEKHYSVEQVSEYMGFESVQAVYKWQSGKSLPTLDNMFALSRLFDTPIENILIERGESESSPLHYVRGTKIQLPVYIHFTRVLR